MKLDENTEFKLNRSQINIYTPKEENHMEGSEATLKYSDYPDLRELVCDFIDRFAEVYALTVFDQVCTHCSRCCRRENIMVAGSDVFRISHRLGMPPDEFRKKYLKKANTWNEYDGYIKLKRKKCPFLKRRSSGRSTCTIYEVRPIGCRNFQANSPMCEKDPAYLVEHLEELTVKGNSIKSTSHSYESTMPKPMELEKTMDLMMVDEELKSRFEKIRQYLMTTSGEMVNLVDQAAEKALELLIKFRENRHIEATKPDFEERLESLREVVEQLSRMNEMGRNENVTMDQLWRELMIIENPDSGDTVATGEEMDIPEDESLIEYKDISVVGINLYSEMLVLNVTCREDDQVYPCPYPLTVSKKLLKQVREFVKKLVTIDEERNQQVVSLVDQPCYLCGKCCSHYSVEIKPTDMIRLADNLGMTEKQYRKKHMTPNRFSWNRGNAIMKKVTSPGIDHPGCGFLEKWDDGYYYCSVHAFKPRVCRMYAPRTALCRRFTNKEYWYTLPESIYLTDLKPNRITLYTNYTFNTDRVGHVIPVKKHPEAAKAYQALLEGIKTEIVIPTVDERDRDKKAVKS